MLIVFGETISPEINRQAIRAERLIRQAKIPGVLDMIPAFASLLVQYDPIRISWCQIQDRVESALETGGEETENEPCRIIEIPVCYGGDFGPDLPHIAEHAGITTDEVIRIHTSRDYLIYMLGFLPGFCYLGGLDERIHTPRLKSPRVRIPAGSVGIGGSQTGIYPMESPGGWQIMGRTPVKLYNPANRDPILLRAGEYIRFQPVDEAEYRKIQDAVDRGTWIPALLEAE